MCLMSCVYIFVCLYACILHLDGDFLGVTWTYGMISVINFSNFFQLLSLKILSLHIYFSPLLLTDINCVLKLLTVSSMTFILCFIFLNFCFTVLYSDNFSDLSSSSLILFVNLLFLLLPFQFWCFLFLFLDWLLWLKFPLLCWIRAVKVGTFVLFLILEENLSIFLTWSMLTADLYSLYYVQICSFYT